MQKEIELKCLCDGLLDALREMGLGKYSLRNYYYEGMWPLIKAYRKAGKELYDPVFTNEVVLGIQKQFQEGLVGNHISMHVRKMAALMEEYSLNRCIVWHRIKPCPASTVKAALRSLKIYYGSQFATVFKTITADNGTEFAELSQLERYGIMVYFAHPYSSYERAQNERHNRIFRKYVPKGKSIENYSAEQILWFAEDMNSLLRKSLEYDTPDDLFEAYLMSAQ